MEGTREEVFVVVFFLHACGRGLVDPRIDLKELSVEACYQCLHLRRIDILDDKFLVLFETLMVVDF